MIKDYIRKTISIKEHQAAWLKLHKHEFNFSAKVQKLIEKMMKEEEQKDD